MPFATIIGLYALLALVPLIIIYLRRPKPVDKIIPSLMFLIKEKGLIKEHSFLKNLIRNLLFFLQLLALTALAFALAKPYIDLEGTAFGSHNVIVLDSSASMQTEINGVSRFDKAIEEAKGYLDGRTSIILGGSTAEIVLENGNRQEAIEVLSIIEPKDTTTNLEAALRAAEPLAKNGKIVVISDFKVTEGQDPLVLKRILASKDIPVDFVDVSNKAENVGIINLEIDKYETKAYVKNFKEQDEKIKAALIQGDSMIEQTKTIKANSVEVYTFDTLPGVGKIELDFKDNLDVDNKAFVSSPLKTKIKTLLITNEKTSYLMDALTSSRDIEMDVAEPPIFPSFEGYDVIIIGYVQSDYILPSVYRDIRVVVDNGTSLIVTAQDNLGNLVFGDLLAVEVKGISEEPTHLTAKVVNQFTKDIDFSSVMVEKYFKTSAANNTAVIVEAANNPTITFRDKNRGRIFYYGIIDKHSDFKLSTSYPIFWNLLLNYLAGTEGIEGYNTKLVDKPILSKVGIYQEKNKHIAANLLTEAESDVSKETKLEAKEGVLAEKIQKQSKLEFDIPLLIVASLLILTELFFIKKRGDL